jgi:menaquinone-dependent protoporphyrinogen oxidase
MRVLVVYASKYGSTGAIAQSIADAIRHTLKTADLGGTVADRDTTAKVEVFEAESAPVPDGFDAVVVGSAVYMGRWMKAARRYIDENANDLANMPLWLFSSGPIGEPARPMTTPADIDEISDIINVRSSHVFAGKLDPHALHLAERAVVLALRAPAGDFRDWTEVSDWGISIASSLLVGVPA